MRIPAKALGCLLTCVACVTIAPCGANEATIPTTPMHASHAMDEAYAHASLQPLVMGSGRVDARTMVATRKRAKSHHAATKLANAGPHDTSNRFLMTQNGRQMTADDFEAWMKARGIRVAKGVPEAAKAAD